MERMENRSALHRARYVIVGVMGAIFLEARARLGMMGVMMTGGFVLCEGRGGGGLWVCDGRGRGERGSCVREVLKCKSFISEGG